MIVVAKMKAKAGQEENLEKTLKGIIPHVEKEEGTLAYVLHRSQSEPGVFLFYEKYIDAEALTIHSSTPHFKALFADVEPLVDGPASIEMYNEVAGFTK